MEGGGNGGGDGDGGWRRVKKTIRHRQAREGSSTAAHEDPLAVPMEEDNAAAALGEDEPVGPKKSELRSRLGWAVVRAIYRGLPDFQRARLDELTTNVALKERWDPECHAFLFPWGHMIPTLEHVVRITGLHVDGQPVTGVTHTSYQELVERLLGLDVTRERSSLISRTGLQASLGGGIGRGGGSGSRPRFEKIPDPCDREADTGTRGDPVSYRCLPLLEDLSSVGSYAWGAALLAHLFDSLGTSSRVTGVWAYHHLPSLGRGEPRWAGAVTLLRRWRFRRDEQSLRWQVTMIHDALNSVPFGHDDAAQPWVERGRPYFGRDIWLHSLNTVVPLHHRMVARTLGLHQSVVEFPTRQRPWERPGRSFHGIQQETDWTVRVREKLIDWE
ncbi:hypothetical protein Taro_030921 [Colocasia esculenta]|uniref:Aminotransferase-like plant mobile domain-containing protein n=1 Tax=Colocasia esculenta TaxID=4460 RepID=A0A843VQF9_COLES|nr:hypothetical protein [Colocasia esculenta]